MLAKELFPIFEPEDLIGLPYYRCYVKLIVDGKPSRPFSGKVMRDSGPRQNQAKPRLDPKTGGGMTTSSRNRDGRARSPRRRRGCLWISV